MGLKVVINKQKKREDGRCAVRIYLYQNRRMSFIPVKNCYCHQKDLRGGIVQATHPNYEDMNRRIREVYEIAESLTLKHPRLHAGEIVALFRTAPLADSLYSFIDSFIRQRVNGGKVGKKTILKYDYSKMRLMHFAPNLKFADINKEFYDSFLSHLRTTDNKRILYNGKIRVVGKLRENTIAGVLKNLKVFISEANDRGLCNILEHKKTYFKAVGEDTDAIYLNEREIKLIEQLDLSKHPHLMTERDRFIVAYYFLNRHSDSIRIDRSMLFSENGKEFIRMRTQKTGSEIIVPVKPIVKEILERNNYCLKFEALQTANYKIKEIGRLAGITEKIFLGEKFDHKYKFISTHTARRSGATNLYLRGVDIRTISKLLGHSDIATTETYIRVNSLQTALTMADHPFYQ